MEFLKGLWEAACWLWNDFIIGTIKTIYNTIKNIFTSEE